MRVAGKYVFLISSIILISLHLSVWIQDNHAFSVRKVFVSGTHLLSSEEVMAVARVDTAGSIWDTDIEIIEERIRALPPVRDVSVSRMFPSNIHIEVEERRPVALLAGNGLWGIDREGVLLPRFRPEVGLDFPIITGFRVKDQVVGQPIRDANILQVARFLADLQTQVPVVYNLLSEITVSELFGIRAILVEQNTPVYFGKKNLIKRSKKLQAAWEYLASERKLARVLYLDLRYDDQVIVKKRMKNRAHT